MGTFSTQPWNIARLLLGGFLISGRRWSPFKSVKNALVILHILWINLERKEKPFFLDEQPQIVRDLTH